MMKYLLGTTITTVMLLGAAQAADLKAPVYKAPPAPVYYNWTGFYIGINGGGAWGHTDWQYNFTSGAPHTFADHKTHGALFGGTVGYNWQFASPWVLGIEADFDWADVLSQPHLQLPVKDQELGHGKGSTRLRLGPDALLWHGRLGVW